MRHGIYKDGDLVGDCHSANGDAVAVNSKNVYLTVGNGLTAFSLAGVAGTLTFAVGSPPAPAAATDTQVIATDRVQNRVVVFDAATGTIVRTWSVTMPGAVAVDPKSGDVWVVSGVTRDTDDGHFWHAGTNGPPVVLGFSNTGTPLSGTISGPAATWLPTCLAIDVWTSTARTRYRMDYANTPGSDSTWLGYTLDSVKYEWIWREANGDGMFTADEYTVPGNGQSSPSNCWCGSSTTGATSGTAATGTCAATRSRASTARATRSTTTRAW